MKNIKYLATAVLAFAILVAKDKASAQALDGTLNSLVVEEGTRLKGVVKFGTLGNDVNMDGLRIDVVQSPVSRLRRVWHPAANNSWIEMEPIYGDITTTWEEVKGHDEYENIEITPYIASYNATEEYEISPSIPAQQIILIPEMPTTYRSAADSNEDGISNDGDIDLDGDGNAESIVDQQGSPAVYQDVPEVPAVIGFREVVVPEQPATYQSISRWVVDEVINHTGTTTGIVGETSVIRNSVTPAYFSSELLAGDPSPVTRFTGTHPEMSFAWANLVDGDGRRKDLMTLSSGGLLLPAGNDQWGYSRASLSQDTFEQSWNGPVWSGEDVETIQYKSFGAKMEKQQVKIWNHSGDYVPVSDTDGAESVEQVSDRKETTLLPGEIVVEESSQSAQNGNNLRSTRISSDFASFGGSVAVKGVLRVSPAGDVGMGQFTNGPTP